MLYRTPGASSLLQAQQKDWKHDNTEHFGFMLISLFEGFITVVIRTLEVQCTVQCTVQCS